jgi:hypothetical protein
LRNFVRRCGLAVEASSVAAMTIGRWKAAVAPIKR